MVSSGCIDKRDLVAAVAVEQSRSVYPDWARTQEHDLPLFPRLDVNARRSVVERKHRCLL